MRLAALILSAWVGGTILAANHRLPGMLDLARPTPAHAVPKVLRP